MLNQKDIFGLPHLVKRSTCYNQIYVSRFVSLHLASIIFRSSFGVSPHIPLQFTTVFASFSLSKGENQKAER